MAFQSDRFVFYKNQGYNEIAIGKPIATCRQREEVIVVSYLFEVFLNVMANVLAYFICKWLDDEDKRQSAYKHPLI